MAYQNRNGYGRRIDMNNYGRRRDRDCDWDRGRRDCDWDRGRRDCDWDRGRRDCDWDRGRRDYDWDRGRVYIKRLNGSEWWFNGFDENDWANEKLFINNNSGYGAAWALFESSTFDRDIITDYEDLKYVLGEVHNLGTVLLIDDDDRDRNGDRTRISLRIDFEEGQQFFVEVDPNRGTRFYTERDYY